MKVTHYPLTDDQRNSIRKCLRELSDAIAILESAECIRVEDPCYEDACKVYHDIYRAIEDAEGILSAERINKYFW